MNSYGRMDDLILCPRCRSVFNSPRLLPCGETLCNNCITRQANSSVIKCIMCDKMHEIPAKNGFPINKQTLKLIDRIRTKSEISDQVAHIEESSQALKLKMSQVIKSFMYI